MTVATVAAGAALAGCGSGGGAGSSAASHSGTQIQVTQTPAPNVVGLVSGTTPQRIAATISTFYRATWENQGAVACSLFSPNGSSGFLQAAKVAFPSSVNQVTTCPDAMKIFNATLADTVDGLQQAGVNVSGNILDNVGVNHIHVQGNRATAEAPQGVEALIKPKLFLLVRVHNRWLIDGSRKIGKTLPQLLAAAKAQGKLRPKHGH